MSFFCCTFAADFEKGIKIMCVLERNTRSITVRMSLRRWDRMVELERAYQVASAVVRAKRECETAPSMTVDEAMQFVRQL